MHCFGRTSLKNRCKNPAKFLVCKTHRLQAFILLLVTMPAIYGSYRTIYKDIRSYTGATLSQTSTIEPFPKDDQSFKILILPFDPLADCSTQENDMGKTIYRRLVELKEQDSLNISVRYDTNRFCPVGFEEGKSLGKELNADLVLWGEMYESCRTDSLEACLRYVLLKGENIPIEPRGKTGIRSVPSMTDISQGFLQRDIDYVVYWTLGSEAYAQGRYRTAVARFERVFNLSPDDPQILNWCGLSLHAAGNYTAAEPLYRRAMKIRETLLGNDHPDVAKTLNNLAALLFYQGNHNAAEPLYRRALKIDEVAYGKNHATVACGLSNLAQLLQDQGNYTGAEPLYRRALKIDEVAYGKNHPTVATALNNLAELLWVQGNYTRAEPLYRRALKIGEAQLGKDHPDVATFLNNLALLLDDRGKYTDAEPLYRRALKIREAKLGKDHPHTKLTRKNLALLLNEMASKQD